MLYRRGRLTASASAYTALLELSINSNNNKSEGDGVAERTKALVATRTVAGWNLGNGQTTGAQFEILSS